MLAASLLSRSALHRLQQQPPLTAAVVVGRKLARHAAVEALHARLLLLVENDVRRVGHLPRRAHTEALIWSKPKAPYCQDLFV